MPDVIIAGAVIKKRDGECAHPSCSNALDFRANDKLPEGWGHIVFSRSTKKGLGGSVTLVVCPEHTMAFTERQPNLNLRGKKLMRVLIESPFAGDVERNLRYLRAAMRDCLKRGEAPFASHALYTQEGVLDDKDKEERKLGIEAGLVWGESAAKAVLYKDLGVSEGMKIGIARHKENGIPVEERRLEGWKP